MSDVSLILADLVMTHVVAMTHQKSKVMSRKRVTCVISLTNSKICVTKKMTHDTYDTWLVPTTRARKDTNTNMCHMCHCCQAAS